MATLKIEVTAPNQALSKYADDLGYQAEIVTGVDEQGNPIKGSNPQSKPAFLAERVKDIVAAALAQQAGASIKRQKDVEAQTEQATLTTQIKSATTVTIV